MKQRSRQAFLARRLRRIRGLAAVNSCADGVPVHSSPLWDKTTQGLSQFYLLGYLPSSPVWVARQGKQSTMPRDREAEANEIRAAAARKRALAAQLAEQLAEDVVGLIHPSGQAGWPEDGEQWTLSFTFHCWKVPPGPLKTQPLSVRITTSRQEYESLWNRLHAYTVIRIRARVAENSVLGTPQAQLSELIGPDNSDPELNQAAVDLQKPVIYRDPQFGNFTLDRRIDWYTAAAEWEGKVVDLNRTLDNSGKLDAALQVGRALWKDQEKWAERVRECSA